MTYNFTSFIDDHQSQLKSADIPEYFWYYLHFKLNDEIYDIGDICDLELNSDKTEVNCVANKELKSSDGTNIFLIDNAWTFELNKAKLQLKENSSLRERVASMVSLDTEGASAECVIDAIFDNFWSHLRYYDITLKIPEERRKMWYMLDEVGTCIKHDEQLPAMRIVPFIYTQTGMCYSVAWLIKDLSVGECFTVNRVEHILDPYLRDCISYIWTKQLPAQVSNVTTMSAEFFTSHRNMESSPDLSVSNLGQLNRNKFPLLVYSDVVFVKNTLTDSRFALTENRNEADICWLFDHFKDYDSLSKEKPQTLINQFPSETVMTIKDLLAALGSESNWIVKTFNLKTELKEYINYVHKAKEEFENNEILETPNSDCPCNCHLLNVDCGVCVEDKSCQQIKHQVGQVWIVKPWNLARGLGIFISDNLEMILRMVEAYPSEPKIASRYITDPVLFYRSDLGANVKFDIRYMVLLSSVDPLRVFITKIFWLRFANKEFVLSDWDDYETHFTVMNYKGDCQLKNIICDEFAELFDKQYPLHPWAAVEKSIHRMLREMMEDVTRRPDPMRIQPSPQSRGMYAVDIMLEWNKGCSAEDKFEICPRVCEVNYCPDCTRACQYHPNFFNDVFSTLFLNEPSNVIELL